MYKIFFILYCMKLGLKEHGDILILWHLENRIRNRVVILSLFWIRFGIGISCSLKQMQLYSSLYLHEIYNIHKIFKHFMEFCKGMHNAWNMRMLITEIKIKIWKNNNNVNWTYSLIKAFINLNLKISPSLCKDCIKKYIYLYIDVKFKNKVWIRIESVKVMTFLCNISWTFTY